MPRSLRGHCCLRLHPRDSNLILVMFCFLASPSDFLSASRLRATALGCLSEVWWPPPVALLNSPYGPEHTIHHFIVLPQPQVSLPLTLNPPHDGQLLKVHSGSEGEHTALWVSAPAHSWARISGSPQGCLAGLPFYPQLCHPWPAAPLLHLRHPALVLVGLPSLPPHTADPNVSVIILYVLFLLFGQLVPLTVYTQVLKVENNEKLHWKPLLHLVSLWLLYSLSGFQRNQCLFHRYHISPPIHVRS